LRADGWHRDLKKLMHLLAVSAGGGLLLGVGIRLADGRRFESASDGSVSPRHRIHDSDDSVDRISPFLARLEALEKRIAPQTPPPEAQAETPDVDRSSSIHELTAQILAVERRLRHDLEQRHEQRLIQLTDALEKRLAQRIGPIEAEMENQRAAVGELRDFSLRTETSLQRLLEGIEKLVVAQQSAKSQY
jgi:hypothetical protein